MTKATIVLNDDTQYSYFEFSSIPRIGDHIKIFDDADGGISENDIQGIVTKIEWLVDHKKANTQEDQSNSVEIYIEGGKIP